MEAYCAWRNASTDPKTLKSDLPVRCKNKGCPGFLNIDPLREDPCKKCEFFLRDMSMESKKKK